MFNNLIGNTENKETLKNMIDSNNISHSYIFSGTSGIGKFEFAKEFAKAIICLSETEPKPCNHCKACESFDNSNNPDIIIIDENEDSIKTETIKELLDWFKMNTPLVGNYLVPVITKDYSGEQLYNHIRSRYVRYAKNLKKLGETLEIERLRLTSYVSRHTMAMTLQNQNVPREQISQALGHNNLTTTNVYLDSFDTNIMDKVAQLL